MSLILLKLKSENKVNHDLLINRHEFLYAKLNEEKDKNQFDFIKNAIVDLKKNNFRIYERKLIKQSKSVMMKWELKEAENLVKSPILLHQKTRMILFH